MKGRHFTHFYRIIMSFDNIGCHYLSTHLVHWCGPLSRLPKHAAELGGRKWQVTVVR